MKTRIAVLASGGGSNLQAMLDHFRALGDAASGEIVVVGSNRPRAGALDRAREAGVDSVVFDPDSAGELDRILATHDAEIVVLAGYLRLVPRSVIERYAGRIVNVHPGPLPRFGGSGMYGLRVHEAVLASGARETAVTIHQVTEQYDDGAALAVWPVAVRSDDTAASLAARVLRIEHIVLPRVVDALAAITALSRDVDLSHI